MAPLSSTARARLPDSAFAYIDSQGRRRLPINDESHVRNALARFEQTAFEDDAARKRARERLLRAAKRYRIVPLGFFDGQLRKERFQGELQARATNVKELPRGVVTFLFTDIEGSTKLVRELGDAYATVLRDVRAVIRACVRATDGCEIDARADEFFAAYAKAAPALEAAAQIQRALAIRLWPKKAHVRVRIGVHTGRPKLTDTGYVGIAVHTAARVCSAGHGGQVLLTAAVREALRGRDPEAATIHSIGAHALAGLPEPEMLFQLTAAGLDDTFPPPRVAAPSAL